MRGIGVVLYAAVLVCFISSAFAADCAGNGELTGHSSCVCQSGYSQADSCAAIADATQMRCVGRNLTFTEANHFPSLDVVTAQATRFEGNTLYAKIQGEYVAKRQYKELKFSPSDKMKALSQDVDAACALGGVGSYWTQSAGYLTADLCNDTFSLQLPWAGHAGCGFANNSKMSQQDPEYLYITGYFHISYVDALGEVDNFTLTRSTSVPYSITVKFQRYVTVQLKALNVSSDVKYGMALTEDVYDPTTSPGTLTLELTTIVNWPNMFFHGATAMKFYHPDQAIILRQDDNGAVSSNQTAGYLIFPKDIDCQTSVENSPCKQTFTFKAQLDATHPTKNCSFDGEYDLEISLYTCRATGSTDPPSCTNQLLNITFTISGSDVCGEIGVTPSVTGDLVSFPPTVTDFRNNWNTKTTFFKLGTNAHFFADIKSDNNDISIKFLTVKFQKQNDGNNWVNLFVDNDAANTLDKIITVYNQEKYFKIYFHSSTFKVVPNSRIVYTFSATCEVSFSGNDGYAGAGTNGKRTIEYTWTQATAEAETNVFLAGEQASNQVAAEQTTPAGVSSVTFIASVVGAVAGTMIIVFVVVGFVLRSRSGKEESSSALLAASAAASEVANRA